MPPSEDRLHPADLLDLDPVQRRVLLLAVRRGRVKRSEALRALPAQAAQTVDEALAGLVARGWLEQARAAREAVFQVRWGRRPSIDLGKTDLRRQLGGRSLYASLSLPEEVEPPTRPAASRQPQALSFMVALAIVNSLVLGILDVVAVSGFVENLNTRSLPWLWTVEMLVGLGFSGFYLQSIDRIPRLKLVHWLLGGLAGLYLVFALLFVAGISTRITFPLLYLIYTQQAIVFPMAFWNLANDEYSLVEARKVFPWLASGEMIGRLIGYALFSLPGLVGWAELESFLAGNPHLLLLVSAALFLIGLFQSRRAPETREQRVEAAARSLRESFDEALDIVRRVPLFRHLTVASTLVWTTLIILWFLFYQSLDNQSGGGGGFALAYSLFNIAYLLVPLLMQWRLTGYLFKVIAPSDVLLGLPLVTLLGVLVGLVFRGDEGMVAAIFLPMVAYNAWDLPAMQALQNLVPEERRGRVRALLSNYSYALGVISGSALLGLLLLFERRLPPDIFRLLALMLALIAALGAVTAALWARSTYEESLLSWRLSRRQRASDVLDKLGDL
jgi:hypothetical protein